MFNLFDISYEITLVLYWILATLLFATGHSFLGLLVLGYSTAGIIFTFLSKILKT